MRVGAVSMSNFTWLRALQELQVANGKPRRACVQVPELVGMSEAQHHVA